ncbi:MAG: D-erythronate dehydrogenase, partial [Phormidesmis sp.]
DGPHYLMHILITGGAGFLGQRLARYLTKDPNLQSLTLTDIVLPPIPADSRINRYQADLTQPQAAKDLITAEMTTVYHLAAVVSAQAEANFDLGMSVNCDGTRYLLEAVRHQAPGAMFILASSLAVFGGDLPAVITDETAVRPQSSYGTQKAISELWVNDYSRKGFIDGRVLRLPTVCVRPGKPNAAASSFASSIIREPLQGKSALCPVDLSLPLWLTSPGTVTANLARSATLPAESFDYAVNLPGITVTVQAMIDALGRVSDPQTLEKIQYQPDDNISQIVAGWPSQFDTSRAERLGFERDRSFDDIIRAFMAEAL